MLTLGFVTPLHILYPLDGLGPAFVCKRIVLIPFYSGLLFSWDWRFPSTMYLAHLMRAKGRSCIHWRCLYSIHFMHALSFLFRFLSFIFDSQGSLANPECPAGRRSTFIQGRMWRIVNLFLTFHLPKRVLGSRLLFENQTCMSIVHARVSFYFLLPCFVLFFVSFIGCEGRISICVCEGEERRGNKGVDPGIVGHEEPGEKAEVGELVSRRFESANTLHIPPI